MKKTRSQKKIPEVYASKPKHQQEKQKLCIEKHTQSTHAKVRQNKT
jgi:hypothetical protein